MKRLAVLLPLLLTACNWPTRGEQADLCAVQALRSQPGVDRFGTVPPGVERMAQTQGKVYGPGLTGYRITYWGLCSRRQRTDTTDMILVGPEPWALTKGGPRAHGRQVGYGTCYHRREGDGWKTVACRINP